MSPFTYLILMKYPIWLIRNESLDI